ncbi:hypothetical protein Btru_077046 [Bulinus truncatus]|nr:hypothetical protein Btru_077046 [Bulinus truncatus]
MAAAVVAQSMEDSLHHTRPTNLSAEPKLTTEVDYQDNPEEEPLLLEGNDASTVHVDQRQNKNLISDLAKADTAESIGDSLVSSGLRHKAEPASGFFQSANKKSKARKTDDTYEDIWLRGEMLASYRQEMNTSAGASSSDHREAVSPPVVDVSRALGVESHQRPGRTFRSSALQGSQKVTLDESEYSQYWRGEVKVIGPEELQKESSLSGIETISMVVPHCVQSLESHRTNHVVLQP